VGQLEFDAKLGEELEALYSTHDVVRRRTIVRRALEARQGERILDAGCGPGFFIAELLDEVGSTGSVAGIDSSPQMLALATRRLEQRANVELHEADVTSMPVRDEDFDGLLSVQVLEYVADIPGVLAEFRRALRPGGRIVLWDVDWSTVSWHSADPDRMQRALTSWDAHLSHPALPRTLGAQLHAAGFENVQVSGYAFVSTDLEPKTYGAALLPPIERYLAGRDDFSGEATAWGDEQRELGENGEFFFACAQFCFTATKP
jgi:ubiquinone/menaquinone biosynthesis C-methylase UbiE